MMSSKQYECKICFNAERNRTFEVQEKMFGLPDKFLYFQCSKCSCLQISETPADLSKYYAEPYASISAGLSSAYENPIKKRITKIRDNYAVFDKGIMGRLLYRKFACEYLRRLSRINLTKSSRILDVGCGTGYTTYGLRELGFQNLLGIDKYIKSDIMFENGLRILKKTIAEAEGMWDLIMFHHSFEHLPDQTGTLKSVEKLLAENGTCLIRMPTVSSYAWEHYSLDWVQLDAPRHLFLHSIKSSQILAERAGFEVSEVLYDSTEFQFWGSEQNLRSIPLLSERSYAINPDNSLFSKKEIKEFRKKATRLNSENRGDSVALYLKRR